jgi:hypothetical protein
MKLALKIRSTIDAMTDLSSDDKVRVVNYLADLKDVLAPNPSPEEAKQIIKGAMKNLKISADKDAEPKEKAEPKEEKKEEKKEPKEDKKEKVDEGIKLSFKAFLSEADMTQFEVTYSKGYAGNPKPQKVSMDFFTDANGFDMDDIKEIKKLQVGSKAHFGGQSDSMEVTRLK